LRLLKIPSKLRRVPLGRELHLNFGSDGDGHFCCGSGWVGLRKPEARPTLKTVEGGGRLGSFSLLLGADTSGHNIVCEGADAGFSKGFVRGS